MRILPKDDNPFLNLTLHTELLTGTPPSHFQNNRPANAATKTPCDKTKPPSEQTTTTSPFKNNTLH